eukprot:TRINITY_DN24785_c0_g1_i2.p1 TRINITY_DN24785_c0_g1~~TRINITY_DN24785_c0_g1_i2.p1  ORF type:complete len:288 (+),score=97.37 TRINITY_DN24785_c0_g1_i2:155-1018(+)
MLQGVTSRDYVILRQKYTKPESIEVSVGGVLIQPKKLVEGKQQDLLKNGPICGANRYNIMERTIEFVLTGAPECIVTLEQVNSVQVSLHMDTTIDKFFEGLGEQEIIDKIAALLKIPRDLVRIVGIRKGSVIVDFVIDVKKDENQTSTNVTDVKSDLQDKANQIVKNVEDGNLNLSAPVMSITYQVLEAPKPTAEGKAGEKILEEPKEEVKEEPPVEIKFPTTRNPGKDVPTGGISWINILLIVGGSLSLLAIVAFAIYFVVSNRRKSHVAHHEETSDHNVAIEIPK